MKHRSPLVTLAAVALAFAIMFSVNMLSGPPGSSSAGTAGPSAAPALPPPTSTSPSADEDARQPRRPPAPSETRPKDSKFPDKVVYAGRTEDDSAAIAVAVLGDKAAAYLCDGRNVESWFRGTVEEHEITLKSKNGATLEAKLDGDHIKGTIEINERHTEVRDQRGEASRPGCYRARGSKTTIGWIVLPDGSQVGSRRPARTPRLRPSSTRRTRRSPLTARARCRARQRRRGSVSRRRLHDQRPGSRARRLPAPNRAAPRSARW